MTTLAEVIVNDVSELLQDINKERWNDAVLLRWLGESEQLIATHKPEAVATKISVSLVVGVDQSLPSDAMMMLRARRNTISGLVVQLVDEDTQNRSDPTWPAATSTVDVESVMYDSKVDPLEFMVSPPNDGTGAVSIVYAKIPVPISATTSPVSVSDSFVPLIKDYIMYRALQMETEGQNLPRSTSHLRTFLMGLGLNTKALDTFDPNREVAANE